MLGEKKPSELGPAGSGAVFFGVAVPGSGCEEWEARCSSPFVFC